MPRDPRSFCFSPSEAPARVMCVGGGRERGGRGGRRCVGGYYRGSDGCGRVYWRVSETPLGGVGVRAGWRGVWERVILVVIRRGVRGVLEGHPPVLSREYMPADMGVCGDCGV